MHRTCALICTALLASCATPRISLDELADRVANVDVVFFGEEHDNVAGHDQHTALLRMLHERRGDVVLSMEMFERDAQPVIDAYVADEISEEDFVDEGRAWPNYARDYRGMVEYAKENGIPIIAANLPRETAKQVASGAVTWSPDLEHAARSTSAPRDAYWRAFVDAMGEHAGISEDTMAKFYAAQCLKDDTMAESIDRAIERYPDALVVHVCGKFHSDHGLGTVSRLIDRRPGVRYRVLSMESRLPVAVGGDGDFTLIVPEAPPRPAKKKDDDGDGDDAAAQGGRPALNFMPDYETEGGCGIAMIIDGGAADRAGLEEGDLIVRIAGRAVANATEYTRALGDLTIGKAVEVVVERDGEERVFEVEVGARSH